jgi:hexokinase
MILSSFEKMISGMYLGEIVRLIILDLINHDLILTEEMKKSTYNHPLFTKGSFYTKYLHEIESDSNSKFIRTKRILKELAGVENPSPQDCAVIKAICCVVTSRAAKLTAAGLLIIKFFSFESHSGN